jgi:hypothetical protein
MHEDRFDCPDAPIDTVRGGYGLIVHDGGSSPAAAASAQGPLAGVQFTGSVQGYTWFFEPRSLTAWFLEPWI